MMRNYLNNYSDTVFEEGDSPISERISKIYSELTKPYNAKLLKKVNNEMAEWQNTLHSLAIDESRRITLKKYGFNINIPLDICRNKFSRNFRRDLEKLIEEKIAQVDKVFFNTLAVYEKNAIKKIIMEG